MNGYEFTRFEADFTARLKAGSYDIEQVKNRIEVDNPDWDYQAEPDYKDAKDWFIDSTMSCDLEEAINWMKYYMLNSIAYGIQTKNLDWRTKFLAAYGIYKHLV